MASLFTDALRPASHLWRVVAGKGTWPAHSGTAARARYPAGRGCEERDQQRPRTSRPEQAEHLERRETEEEEAQDRYTLEPFPTMRPDEHGSSSVHLAIPCSDHATIGRAYTPLQRQ